MGRPKKKSRRDDASSDIEVIESKPASKKSSSSVTSFFAPKPKLKQPPVSSQANPIVLPDSPAKGPSTFADYDELRREEQKKRAAAVQGIQVTWPSSFNAHVRGDALCDRLYGSVDTSVTARLGLLEKRPRKKPRLDVDLTSSQAVHQLVADHDATAVHSTLPESEQYLLPRASTSKVTLDSDEPLVTRILHEADQESDDQEMWTSKYAPRSAEEVLGEKNRDNARLLRSWLKELALRKPNSDPELSQPTRTVTRRAEKPKKKRRRSEFSDDELDDFIVETDDEKDSQPALAFFDEEDMDDIRAPDTSDQMTSLQKTPNKKQKRVIPESSPLPTSSPVKPTVSSIREHQFDRLANLILLQGPVASGKTSTVYAVAQELGWEVFEVFPGQGKRSKQDLIQAVGDVGKNYLVWNSSKIAKSAIGSPKGKSSVGGLAGFFGGQAKAGGDKPKTGASKPNGTNKLNGENASEPQAVRKDISQSLILIEEVDILFPDDKSHQSFWDGIVHIVANSLRPVVLTCNSTASIPFDRLALQTALLFQAPSEGEALPFLQAVAKVQGLDCEPNYLSTLYQRQIYRIPTQCPPSRSSSQLPLSLVLQATPTLDLRRTLTCMQFWCRTVQDKQPKLAQTNGLRQSTRTDLPTCVRFTQLLSRADAFASRRPGIHLEAFDGGAAPQEDQRELEHRYLDVYASELSPNGLPDLLADEDMFSELVTLAEKDCLQSVQHSAFRLKDYPADEQLEDDRALLLRKLETIGNAVLPLYAPLLPSAAACTDHCPYIITIIEADDRQDELFQAMIPSSDDGPAPLPRPIASGVRKSRRLNGEFAQQYERVLDVDPSILFVARQIRLK